MFVLYILLLYVMHFLFNILLKLISNNRFMYFINHFILFLMGISLVIFISALLFDYILPYFGIKDTTQHIINIDENSKMLNNYTQNIDQSQPIAPIDNINLNIENPYLGKDWKTFFTSFFDVDSYYIYLKELFGVYGYDRCVYAYGRTVIYICIIGASTYFIHELITSAHPSVFVDTGVQKKEMPKLLPMTEHSKNIITLLKLHTVHDYSYLTNFMYEGIRSLGTFPELTILDASEIYRDMARDIAVQENRMVTKEFFFTLIKNYNAYRMNNNITFTASHEGWEKYLIGLKYYVLKAMALSK